MSPNLPDVDALSARAAAALDRVALQLRADGAPEDESVVTLAEAIARYVVARGARLPRKSASAWLRENLRVLEPPLEAESRRRLVTMLRERVPQALLSTARSVPPEERGLDERDVAARLGIEPAVLSASLRKKSGRRALGWPLHIGGERFRWQRRWLDDAQVFAFRQAHEEPPHLAALPAGFEE